MVLSWKDKCCDEIIGMNLEKFQTVGLTRGDIRLWVIESKRQNDGIFDEFD